MFVQRADFVVSVVAELPANRGTYTACRLSRHFASVVGRLRASVSAVMLSQPQFGGAPKCSVSDRTSQKSQLRSPSSRPFPHRSSRGHESVSRFLRPRRGAARSAQTAHADDMELAARSEPQTLPRRASCECVRVRCKKRGPNRDRIDDQVQ